MKQAKISLTNLTEEDVWNLSEEEAFDLLEMLKNTVDREQYLALTKLIGKAFDFRSISPKRRDLKQDLIKSGFKFFTPEQGIGNLLLGIYKRHKSSFL